MHRRYYIAVIGLMGGLDPPSLGPAEYTIITQHHIFHIFENANVIEPSFLECMVDFCRIRWLLHQSFDITVYTLCKHLKTESIYDKSHGFIRMGQYLRILVHVENCCWANVHLLTNAERHRGPTHQSSALACLTKLTWNAPLHKFAS